MIKNEVLDLPTWVLFLKKLSQMSFHAMHKVHLTLHEINSTDQIATSFSGGEHLAWIQRPGPNASPNLFYGAQLPSISINMSLCWLAFAQGAAANSCRHGVSVLSPRTV